MGSGTGRRAVLQHQEEAACFPQLTLVLVPGINSSGGGCHSESVQVVSQADGVGVASVPRM